MVRSSGSSVDRFRGNRGRRGGCSRRTACRLGWSRPFPTWWSHVRGTRPERAARAIVDVPRRYRREEGELFSVRGVASLWPKEVRSPATVVNRPDDARNSDNAHVCPFSCHVKTERPPTSGTVSREPTIPIDTNTLSAAARVRRSWFIANGFSFSNGRATPPHSAVPPGGDRSRISAVPLSSRRSTESPESVGCAKRTAATTLGRGGAYPCDERSARWSAITFRSDVTELTRFDTAVSRVRKFADGKSRDRERESERVSEWRGRRRTATATTFPTLIARGKKTVRNYKTITVRLSRGIRVEQ